MKNPLELKLRLPADYNPEIRMFILGDFCHDEDIHSVLELGRQEGLGSTWHFVNSGAEVWSVDITDAQFRAFELKECPNYHHIVSDSTKDIPELDGLDFDLVFIDSSHMYDQTVIELAKYYPKTKKWLLVDDYNYTGDFTHSPVDYNWGRLCYKAFVESGLTFSPVLARRDYSETNEVGRVWDGPKKDKVCFYGVRIGGPNGPSPLNDSYEICPFCSFVAYDIFPMNQASPRSGVSPDEQGFMCPKCQRKFLKGADKNS